MEGMCIPVFWSWEYYSPTFQTYGSKNSIDFPSLYSVAIIALITLRLTALGHVHCSTGQYWGNKIVFLKKFINCRVINCDDALCNACLFANYDVHTSSAFEVTQDLDLDFEDLITSLMNTLDLGVKRSRSQWNDLC